MVYISQPCNVYAPHNGFTWCDLKKMRLWQPRLWHNWRPVHITVMCNISSTFCYFLFLFTFSLNLCVSFSDDVAGLQNARHVEGHRLDTERGINLKFLVHFVGAQLLELLQGVCGDNAMLQAAPSQSAAWESSRHWQEPRSVETGLDWFPHHATPPTVKLRDRSSLDVTCHTAARKSHGYRYGYMTVGMGTGTCTWVWVRVHVHGYRYGSSMWQSHGYGYETMGTGMGTGTTSLMYVMQQGDIGNQMIDIVLYM